MAKSNAEDEEQIAIGPIVWIVLIFLGFLFIMLVILFSVKDRPVSVINKFEYETLEGEKGMAVDCYGSSRVTPSPYCVLEDGTKIYSIKITKRIRY